MKTKTKTKTQFPGEYRSMYDDTGSILDLNTICVPLHVLREMERRFEAVEIIAITGISLISKEIFGDESDIWNSWADRNVDRAMDDKSSIYECVTAAILAMDTRQAELALLNVDIETPKNKLVRDSEEPPTGNSNDQTVG